MVTGLLYEHMPVLCMRQERERERESFIGGSGGGGVWGWCLRALKNPIHVGIKVNVSHSGNGNYEIDITNNK